MKINQIQQDKVTIISTDKTWLEQAAVDQLKAVSRLEGVVKAIGLPDLHPGKTPVGAAILTEEVIYPHLIGNDIGCGMSLYMTSVDKRKAKLGRWIKRLEGIESLSEIPLPEDIVAHTSTLPNSSDIGTIGGGNHFAELQELNEVLDSDEFNSLGIQKSNLLLLIHSGSRKLGAEILEAFSEKKEGYGGLAFGSQQGQLYLAKHEEALRWASLNRDAIAYRILNAIGINPFPQKVINCAHNALSIKEVNSQKLLIHRKGAAPGDAGAVVIPGSRGTLSYIVMPMEDTAASGYSLAHGAGRKWERSVCKAKLADKYTKETIKTTKLKSRVICHDTNLLYEEAPEAYKNIHTVIQDLLDAKLIKLVATLKPILTYKA